MPNEGQPFAELAVAPKILRIGIILGARELLSCLSTMSCCQGLS